MKRSEQDIAALVVQWLRDGHWDVYQEVQVGGGGPRADIVVTQGPLVGVVEVKRSLSLSLLAQADHWRWRSNLVWVASESRRGFGDVICAERGIGVLFAGLYGGHIVERVRPCLHRGAGTRQLLEMLRPEHKTWALAGSPSGGHWTPFTATCREVRRVVERHPDGVSLCDLVREITHHYRTDATARSCLARWIEAGKVPGVASEMRAGKLVVVEKPKTGDETESG